MQSNFRFNPDLLPNHKFSPVSRCTYKMGLKKKKKKGCVYVHHNLKLAPVNGNELSIGLEREKFSLAT